MGNLIPSGHPAAPAAPHQPAAPTKANSVSKPQSPAAPTILSPAPPATAAAPAAPTPIKGPQTPSSPAAPSVAKGKTIHLGGRRTRRPEKSAIIKKKYYGRKKGKVIQLYGHKIPKRIGRHRFIIKWKTTKKNLPNKTYYGKFYNTRKAAQQRIRTSRRKTRRRCRSCRRRR